MDIKERLLRRDYSALDRPEVLELLFHPVRMEKNRAPAAGVDHDIPVGDGITVGARFHLPAEKDGPNIIFFHGNGELAADYDEAGSSFVDRQTGFIAVDYRGYGWSGGRPSVTTLIRDSHAVFDYVRAQLAAEERRGHLVVMGRSLGSAAALELAAFRHHDLAGVVIESGFANTGPVLGALGIDIEPLGIGEEDGFGNLQKVRAYSKPLLVLHARNDGIIPIGEAAALHAECGAAGKELQIIPGADHNNILQVTGEMYYEVICRFARRLGRPARRKKSGVR